MAGDDDDDDDDYDIDKMMMILICDRCQVTPRGKSRSHCSARQSVRP